MEEKWHGEIRMVHDVLDDKTMDFLRDRFGIIGESDIMRDIMLQLLKVSPTNLTVLITGETGTGKEVFAHAMHGLSERSTQPFISVNCGAIPETLLESELFGHEKGAFTGAVEQRKGFFEVAHKGTIFLDEIGEMPIATQVKLLRILESGEFSRIGSSEIRKVNVRVITATNRDLEYEVRNGRFRQDLYFRLNSFQLRLPSLRKHPEDIPVLAEYYASRIAKKNKFSYKGFTDDAFEYLTSLSWPGNIRELRNVVETVSTLDHGKQITQSMLSQQIQDHGGNQGTIPTDQAIVVSTHGYQRNSQLPQESDIVFRTLLEMKNELIEIKRAMAAIFEKTAQLEMQAQRAAEQSITEFPVITNHSLPFPDEYSSDAQFNLEEMEKQLIQSALTKYAGNRRMAAKILGISERTLYRKITDYQLSEQ
ncbi:sigma-54-dependent Fis family transcriptional regulator [bacterium]|nr:sigma-54-dependent Fis family transcriptional regulator [bacterium]